MLQFHPVIMHFYQMAWSIFIQRIIFCLFFEKIVTFNEKYYCSMSLNMKC